MSRYHTMSDSEEESMGIDESLENVNEMQTSQSVSKICSDSEPESSDPVAPSKENADNLAICSDPSTSKGAISKGVKRLLSSDSESNEDANNDENASSSTDSEGGDSMCSICLSKYRGETGNPENCQHVYCLECIIMWSERTATCPQDRIPFAKIKVRKSRHEQEHYRTMDIATVKKKPIDEEDILVVHDDHTYCEVCRRSDREDELLLCDGCDLGFHLFCLNPPLATVPIDEWYCETCTNASIVDEGRTQNIASAINRVVDRAASSQPSIIRQRRTSNSPRVLPRTQQVVRVRARVKAIRKKRRKQKNKRRRSRKAAKKDADSDEDTEGTSRRKKPKDTVALFSLTGRVCDSDIDAMFNEDKYAEELLKKNLEEQNDSDYLDPNKPNPNYGGRVSVGLQQRVESAVAAGPVDLLGDILDDQSVLLSNGKYLSIDENRKLNVAEEYKRDTTNLFDESGLEFMKKPLPSQQKLIDEQEKVRLEEERLREAEEKRKRELKEKEEEMMAKRKRDEEIKRSREMSTKYDRHSSYRSSYDRPRSYTDDNHYRSNKDASRYNGRESRFDRKHSNYDREYSRGRDRSDSRHSKDGSDSRSGQRPDSRFDQNRTESNRKNTSHSNRETNSSSRRNGFGEHSYRKHDSKKDQSNESRNKLFFGHSKYEIKKTSNSEAKSDDTSLVAMSVPRGLFANKSHVELRTSKPVELNLKESLPISDGNVCSKIKVDGNAKFDSSLVSEGSKNKNLPALLHSDVKSKDVNGVPDVSDTKKKNGDNRMKSLFGDDSFEEIEPKCTKTDNKALVKSSKKSSQDNPNSTKDITKEIVKDKTTKDVKTANATSLSFEDTLQNIFAPKSSEKKSTGKKSNNGVESREVEKEPLKKRENIHTDSYNKRKPETSHKNKSDSQSMKKTEPKHIKQSDADLNSSADISNRLDLIFGSIEDITESSSNSNTPSNSMRKSSMPPPLSCIPSNSPFNSHSLDFHSYMQYDYNDDILESSISEPENPAGQKRYSRGQHRKSNSGTEDSPVANAEPVPVFVVVQSKKNEERPKSDQVKVHSKRGSDKEEKVNNDRDGGKHSSGKVKEELGKKKTLDSMNSGPKSDLSEEVSESTFNQKADSSKFSNLSKTIECVESSLKELLKSPPKDEPVAIVPPPPTVQPNPVTEHSAKSINVTNEKKPDAKKTPLDESKKVPIKESSSKKIPLEKNALLVAVKSFLDPHYHNQTLNKDQYKEIIAKCLAKVLNSQDKAREVPTEKIKQLTEGYVAVYRHRATKRK